MSEPEWPLWSAEHPRPGSDPRFCPNCGQPIAPDAAFCEGCGTTLNPSQPATITPARSSGSTQTRRLGSRASNAVTCALCGGTIDADGYCSTCGAKAPSARDHYTSVPAAWVAGVCDRGIHHTRNEDALALWADEDRAVLVVCDGVSSSVDADAAATAAAEAVLTYLVEWVGTLTAGVPVEPDAASAAFVEAAARANHAVIAVTAADSTNAASTTLAVAVVLADEVHYANLGDSRVYVLTESGGSLLSVDDSMAQAFIAEGMDRVEAEALPRAHAITKWLGRDAVDIVPRTGTYLVQDPGWVAVCSDGLWNYASGPAELAAQLAAATTGGDNPAAVAGRLVAWANAQGGKDNVTVALARCPALPATITVDPEMVSGTEEYPEHG